ncbi:LysR family transcriptional regulator [Rhizobium sp. YIM 134829]|uniref:LysR family transcriptional regulator n=1 Tax=Rhizobium sp. YIM 134829 TaxID=3390453 RepID=UPI0039786094
MDQPREQVISGFDASARSIFKSGLKMNHLHLILAIEEHGQISAAADALGISQPAASRLLGEVEAIVKAPLCARIARGVELTQFGRALARRARSIFLELRETAREITELKYGSGGSVSLGSVTGPAIHLAVPAVRQVTAAYPGIEINIQIENSNVLMRELLAARHDFVIGRVPDDLDPRLFSMVEIGEEAVDLIVRRNHPLLEEGRITPEMLLRYDWVFQPPSTLLRRAVEESFVAAGVPLPKTVINTSSTILTLSIVKETNAIAAVARDVAALVSDNGTPLGEIRRLPIRHRIRIRPYSLITAAGRALPPSATLLYDLIRKQAHA